MNYVKRFSVFALLLALLFGTTACMEERATVDKSPTLALDKKLFEGEFFYRQTVTELPYTADYAFIGESSKGAIVKWKITKNWLIGYNVHDNLEIVNTEEIPSVNETPVVAYRILDHFDILPQENPTTGEDMPVLRPNHDKPWNERNYFLIDQSMSGVSNNQLTYMWMDESWGKAPYYRSGLTSATDFEFYAHDGSFIPPKKYRDMLDDAGEDSFDKQVEWFQFNSQEYLTPINSWAGIYNWDDIDEFIKMEPARVNYRHVFVKVNRDVYGKRTYDGETESWIWKKGERDNGFRPLLYPDELFREFGFFTNNFRGYNPEYGYKEDMYYEMANIFNIAWGKLSDKTVSDNVLTEGNVATDWNFQCYKSADNVPDDMVKAYSSCIEDIDLQQKVIFSYSPETPKRMIASDCAIAKDYNHAMLAARFAYMNPGSTTKDFDKWYRNNYENDFFTKINDYKVRDEDWYTTVDAMGNSDVHSDWMEKCFNVPDRDALVQNWDGTVTADDHVNDIVIFAENPVEGYISARDARHLGEYSNYEDYDDNGTAENALRICVPQNEASENEDKLTYYYNCIKNDAKMQSLYEETYGDSEWRGDRWDCRVLEEGETCDDIASVEPSAKDDITYVEAKAACMLTEERTCEVGKNGKPKLRYKYSNGDMRGALINWVDEPTVYGILGVSQWNSNPETGQTLAAGSNVAGSVLQWANNRAIEFAKVTYNKDNPDDPFAWNWEEFINPEYADYPDELWKNNPKETSGEYETRSVVVDTGKKNVVDADSDVIKKSTVYRDLIKNSDKAWAKTQSMKRFDFKAVKGTQYQSQMIPPSIKRAIFPWVPDDNYTQEMEDMMSPIYTGMNLLRYEMTANDLFQAEMDIENEKIKNTFFDLSYIDGAIVQFIKERAQKLHADGIEGQEYIDKLTEAIYNDLEVLMYKAVAEHEMGHSVGLRHNFISSADITNYRDGYFHESNYPSYRKEVEKMVRAAEQEVIDAYPGGGEDYETARDLRLSTLGREIYNKMRDFSHLRTNAGETVDYVDNYDPKVKPMNYYTYVSVMDYQSEPYIHAVGLGKYDKAALKFAYGRSVEQYMIDDNNSVVMDTDNVMRSSDFPLPVLKNRVFINPDTGKLKTVSVPKELVKYKDSDGKMVEKLLPKVKRDDIGGLYKEDGYFKLDKDENNPDYLVNDGSMHEYLFFSDEKRSDEPANNIFDSGSSAVDMVRSMRDQTDKFYYYRFFRRGNPKFREFRGRTSMKMLYRAYLRDYKYVHFLLDFNYNLMKAGWYGYAPMYVNSQTGEPVCGQTEESWPIPDPTQEYGDTDEIPAREKMVRNYNCEEMINATKGWEYWIQNPRDADINSAAVQTVTPLGPGDYLLAGMEGINYLVFDQIYRPDAEDYMRQDRYLEGPGEADADANNPNGVDDDNDGFIDDVTGVDDDGDGIIDEDNNYGTLNAEKLEPEQGGYWVKNPLIFDKGTAENQTALGINPDNYFPVDAYIGRYHDPHWDIQDDPETYYEEVIHGGWAIEQAVGIFVTSNQGWMSGKYRREHMANGLGTYTPGVENVIDNILSDIANHDSLVTFSPYCFDLEKREVVNLRYQLPQDFLMNFRDAPIVYPGSSASKITYDIPKNVCAWYGESMGEPSRYEPFHAGWLYFDKLAPLYWSIGNVINTSADTSILYKYYTFKYPEHERNMYPEPDIDEVEAKSSVGNVYYRAKLPTMDFTNVDYGDLLWYKNEKKAAEEDGRAMDMEMALCEGEFGTDKYGDIVAATKQCLRECVAGVDDDIDADGDDVMDAQSTQCSGDYIVKYESKEELKNYISERYARFSPAFRLVQSLSRLTGQDSGAISSDPEGSQTVTIMETTLDQMNTFVKDHFDTAILYAYMI